MIKINESRSPSVRSGSDHQSLCARIPSFGSGGGRGTLRPIAVLMSTMHSILSATQTEVTVKGAAALLLAGLAFTLSAKSPSRPHSKNQKVSSLPIRVRLEQSGSTHSQRSAIVRLFVGGVLTGSAIAVITSVTFAILVSTFLGRPN